MARQPSSSKPQRTLILDLDKLEAELSSFKHAACNQSTSLNNRIAAEGAAQALQWLIEGGLDTSYVRLKPDTFLIIPEQPLRAS